MKNLKTSILALLLVTILLSCQKSETFLILTNDASIERIDEPITISRVKLEEHIGKIAKGLVPMLVTENGEIIPSQADDLNADGQWDELFFLASLSENSRLKLKVTLVKPEDLPGFTKRSNVWLGSTKEDGTYMEVLSVKRPNITRENHGQTRLYFQFEGPGWENDKVGFRNYFDERNGMDIFGKTTTEMVLQNVGINEDYHLLQTWGMDILKVGASLGAGSLALEINEKLYRIAPGSEGTYEVITNGPLRSIFRLRFDNWLVEEKIYSVLHEITIYGGAWYYISKVIVDGGDEEKRLVTGITTIDLEEKQAAFNDYENGVVSISTHGKQAIEGEYLGMAVMINKDSYIDFEYLDENAEDINHTFIVRMKLSDEPISFRYYSAWEFSDENFADPLKFKELLKFDAIRLGSPVLVEIKM